MAKRARGKRHGAQPEGALSKQKRNKTWGTTIGAVGAHSNNYSSGAGRSGSNVHQHQIQLRRAAEALANGLNVQGRRAFGMAKHKQHQPFSTAIIVRNLHQQQIQLWRVNIFLEWNYIVKKSKIIAHN